MDNEHPTRPRPTIEQISAIQFQAIQQAAARDGVFFEAELSGEAPSHIWQKHHLLVAGDVDQKDNTDLIRLGARLAPNVDGSEQEVSADRVKLLRLANPGKKTTQEHLLELNETDALRGKVFLNSLFYVSHGDGANLCAGEEPTPIRPYPQGVPYPPAACTAAGRGVRVQVVDTGLSSGWKKNHPWLYDPARNPPTEVSGDTEMNTFEANGEIQPHAGHGVYIAGLIRCVAPRTTVRVSNTMRWAGAMHEFEVTNAMLKALKRRPDIISFSAGCTIPDWAPYQGPRSMLDVLDRLRDRRCRTLLVAAAGNDGNGPQSGESFYPAAFAEADPLAGENLVVAVGALRQDRLGRACFSNWGDWVTLYEDGERLVNAFPVGRYTYREPLSSTTPPRCVYHAPDFEPGCTCVTAPARGAVANFHGMANWSGTSFATPIVVGRIARHITDNPQFARQPRAALGDLLNQTTTIKDAGDGTQLRVFPTPVG